MAAYSILYAVDSDVCSSTARKELTDAFRWQRAIIVYMVGVYRLSQILWSHSSRDANKRGGEVNYLVTSHVNKDGERPCLRRSRGLSKDGGCRNFGRLHGA